MTYIQYFAVLILLVFLFDLTTAQIAVGNEPCAILCGGGSGGGGGGGISPWRSAGRGRPLPRPCSYVSTSICFCPEAGFVQEVCDTRGVTYINPCVMGCHGGEFASWGRCGWPCGDEVVLP